MNSATATNSALTTPLKPSEAAAAIRTCLLAGRAPMLHSDPGMGKSSMMLQAADELFAERYGCDLRQDYTVWTRAKKGEKSRQLSASDRPWWRDFRTSLHDSVDLTGAPQVVNGFTRFAVPEFLPTDPRGGVFFLDEINRGAALTRNACFSLVLDRMLGSYHMPVAWVCASAVNDRDLGAAKMEAALTRRFTHLDITTDLNDVCAYAVRCNWEPVVVAYLRMFPMDLNDFDPKTRVGPNPRAWEFISQLVAQNLGNKRIEHALFAGNVGEDRAVKFSAFLRMFRSLPNIDGILLDPKKADVPTDVGALYAVSAALGRRAEASNFGRVMAYLERLPAEYSVFAVKDATSRDKSLQQTPEFTRWAVAMAAKGVTL
jgi:hypothetical protein